MVNITIYGNSGQGYTAFECMGHAGYAEAGEDIVCAAISVLVINTVNSIEQFTGDKFDLVQDQESGLIGFSLQDGASQVSLLLMRSLVLGLQGIQANYKNDYMTLTFKEV